MGNYQYIIHGCPLRKRFFQKYFQLPLPFWLRFCIVIFWSYPLWPLDQHTVRVNILTWRIVERVLAYFASGAWRGGKHVLQYAHMTIASQWKLSPNSDMKRLIQTVSNEGNGAPRCGGARGISMPCCMCEPTATAQSPGDDTHAVVTRSTWA